jgi:drug/metabolite transporter (DMT)-like permease
MGSVAEIAPPHSKRSEAFAASMLVLACLCWGAFFSLAKNWLEAAKTTCPGGELVGTLTLLGIRPVLALLVLALLRPRLFKQATGREWRFGFLLGLLNGVGNIFQVWGLSFTSPALSGFFTSMASLWVPVIALIFLRRPSGAMIWLGLLWGLCGLAVLGIDTSKGIRLGQGEALTALSSLIFAVFILALDRAGKTVRGSHLTLGLIAGAGVPMLPLTLAVSASEAGIPVWFDWLITVLSDREMIRDLVLLTLLSTVVATHLMGTFQPRVSASRAALIYLLEPVFAATLSVLVGYDALTVRLVVGGLLILVGNALPEVPKWLRRGNGM